MTLRHAIERGYAKSSDRTARFALWEGRLGCVRQVWLNSPSAGTKQDNGWQPIALSGGWKGARNPPEGFSGVMEKKRATSRRQRFRGPRSSTWTQTCCAYRLSLIERRLSSLGRSTNPMVGPKQCFPLSDREIGFWMLVAGRDDT